ncbi:MAG: amidohydrolase family protein [Phycisphaerales bacterium]|nr:amidohydrolase family protein [Phycisphaerales bacterium]MCB9864423.1 amidohydrolase family protein [Phycisphaerales bacterium]
MRRTLIQALTILVTCVVVWSADVARAQDEKGPGVVIIRGATVWTGAEQGTLEDGMIMLRKGKVSRVGSGGRAAPPMPGVEMIDASGMYITPGLIDAWTMLGLDPGGPVEAGATQNAADALDCFARDVFEDARRAGVTSLCIEPPAISGVVGTAVVVRLADLSDLRSTMTDSTSLVARLGLGVRGPISRLGEIKALHDAFEQGAAYRESWDEYREKLEEYEKKLKDGETVKLKKEDDKPEEKAEAKPDERPRRGPRGRRRGPRPRPSNFDSMSDSELLAWLQDTHVPGEDPLEGETHGDEDAPIAPEAEKPAKDAEKKDDGKKGGKKEGDELTKPERPAFDANLEVVVRALKRELPVRFEAHRPGDIAFALKIISEFHLDGTIVGATGAYLAKDRVVDAGVPIVFGQLTGAGGFDRSHTAEFDAEAPAALAAVGVESIVIGSGRKGGNSGAQYLAQNAAIAVGHGLSEDSALRAITIDAAKACGIDETLGSIEQGKLADIVIWSGHPLAPDSVVERVFVGGVEVYRRAGN